VSERLLRSLGILAAHLGLGFPSVRDDKGRSHVTWAAVGSNDSVWGELRVRHGMVGRKDGGSFSLQARESAEQGGAGKPTLNHLRTGPWKR
jgi:hypothetical protein